MNLPCDLVQIENQSKMTQRKDLIKLHASWPRDYTQVGEKPRPLLRNSHAVAPWGRPIAPPPLLDLDHTGHDCAHRNADRQFGGAQRQRMQEFPRGRDVYRCELHHYCESAGAEIALFVKKLRLKMVSRSERAANAGKT